MASQVACLFFFGFSSIFNISDNQCKNISAAKTTPSDNNDNIFLFRDKRKVFCLGVSMTNDYLIIFI